MFGRTVFPPGTPHFAAELGSVAALQALKAEAARAGSPRERLLQARDGRRQAGGRAGAPRRHTAAGMRARALRMRMRALCHAVACHAMPCNATRP
jgi:hypothetical protein